MYQGGSYAPSEGTESGRMIFTWNEANAINPGRHKFPVKARFTKFKVKIRTVLLSPIDLRYLSMQTVSL